MAATVTVLFHSIACTDTRCDPPRVEDIVRRNRAGEVTTIIGVELDGCPIGDPDAVIARRDADGTVRVVLRRSFAELAP